MNRSYGFIIQARINSTRLPGKIILPFYKGKTILEILLNRLLLSFPDIPIIVATGLQKDDDQVEMLVNKIKGAKLFRGDEENVLKRFVDSAEYYKIESIIRVCSDNVFIDKDLTQQLLITNEKIVADYVSYHLQDGLPVIKSHFGFFTELVSLEALQKVMNFTSEAKYLEHVTNYIYTHSGLFNTHLVPAPDDLYYLNDIRLTIDTRTDFANSLSVYTHLIENSYSINYQNVLKIVQSDENLKTSMKEQIKLNCK